MIDTHTHLYLPEFAPEPGEAVSRAIAAGVEMMVLPNVDLTTIGPQRSLHEAFPDHTVMAMGLHPTEIGPQWRDDLARVEQELRSRRGDYVAVGEVGIDLYWDRSWRFEQRQALEIQAGWAGEMELPLIIHCREGLDDLLDTLGGMGLKVPVVFHSFTGTDADVDRIRDTVADPWFGINGVVTFKNSRLRDTLPRIGLEKMLLETDSPYLAPVPHRGRRNESAFIIHTAAHVAASLGVSADEVDRATTANARRVFGL